MYNVKNYYSVTDNIFQLIVDFWHMLLVNDDDNNNNNNNTSICKAHNVRIRAESEAPAVARWTGWLEG